MSVTGDLGTIERLYVLHAGYAIHSDRSVYTPGKWERVQVTLPCHAYLIRREGQWILWDTGTEDAVETIAGGSIIAHSLRAIVVRPIGQQLAELGVAPSDVGTVILSHAHFDHVGNAAMFARARWYIQRREYDAMFGPDHLEHGFDTAQYGCLEQADVRLVDGDLDVFGDDSIRIVSTPGHTPGHCSLLVRPPKTGPILLSGDVAHNWYNMENRCVPSFNFSAEQTRQSMARVDSLIRETGAQLWLNHDNSQSATLPHAPAFFD